MRNFIELWYCSADRCGTVDQQLVASVLERFELEFASGHAWPAILS